VAVDGGGQLLAVVHGQRLGCFAVEGVGKAGTPQGLCPGLSWVQRLCPCLERATGRSGCLPAKLSGSSLVAAGVFLLCWLPAFYWRGFQGIARQTEVCISAPFPGTKPVILGNKKGISYGQNVQKNEAPV